MSINRSQNGETQDIEVSSSKRGDRSLVVSVEGNIGCGKSTFLKYCKTKPGIDVFPEPVDKWQNVDGENLLLKFYQNPNKWAMTFQLYANMTILDIYNANSWRAIKLIERSILSSRNCSFEQKKRSGTIEPLMGNVTDEWHDRVESQVESKPHIIAYLRTSPEVAYERIRSRGRIEEAGIQLPYLQQLHALHDSWIDRLTESNLAHQTDLPIYIIDADRPMAMLYQQYEACLEFIDVHLSM